MPNAKYKKPKSGHTAKNGFGDGKQLPKPFKVGELTFDYVFECAKHFNRSVSTVQKYKQQGRLEALLFEINYRDSPTKWRSFTFESVSECSRMLGYQRKTIRKHIDKYGTIDHMRPRKYSPMWCKYNRSFGDEK